MAARVRTASPTVQSGSPRPSIASRKFSACRTTSALAGKIQGARFESLGARRVSSFSEPTRSMLLSAQELLAGGRVPSREEIRAHLSGNYCRCTGYQAIVDAVEAVAMARAARGAP